MKAMAVPCSHCMQNQDEAFFCSYSFDFRPGILTFKVKIIP